MGDQCFQIGLFQGIGNSSKILQYFGNIFIAFFQIVGNLSQLFNDCESDP